MNVGFRIPTKVDAEPAERTFDLRQYLNFVWRHWMFIASVTALALLVGVVYLARATPLYTASTQILLEQPRRLPGAWQRWRCRFDDVFVRGEPACHPAIRLAAAKGCHKRAACAVRPKSKGIAERRRPKKMPRHQRKKRIQAAINGLRGALGSFAQRGRLRSSTFRSPGTIRCELRSSPTP